MYLFLFLRSLFKYSLLFLGVLGIRQWLFLCNINKWIGFIYMVLWIVWFCWWLFPSAWHKQEPGEQRKRVCSWDKWDGYAERRGWRGRSSGSLHPCAHAVLWSWGGEGPSLSGDAVPGCAVQQRIRLHALSGTCVTAGDRLPATGQRSHRT